MTDTDPDNSEDTKPLKQMEERLETLFNKCYDGRDRGSTHAEDAQIADAAARLAEAFVTIRQQRLFESGETTEIAKRNSRQARTHYTKRQKS